MSARGMDGNGRHALRVADIINLDSSARTLLRERVLALRQAGIDNRIVCMDGPAVAGLRAEGIPVHTVHLPRTLDPLRMTLALGEIAAYLRRERIDVVHTHCSVPGFVGRLAARLAGVPTVVHTVHGFHFHERSPWLKRSTFVLAEWLCGRLTDRLLTQNQGDLDLAERFRIGPPGGRQRIGNGIDLERYRPAPRVHDPGRPFTVACIARMEAVKNHGMLFDALRVLLRRGESMRVLLIGDGPLRPRYERLCRLMQIDGAVEFLGYRVDVPELLAGCDAGVLTSMKEGIPRAVLEPMAMALPVVGTRVPGTREAVRHGETGLLVRLGDVEGLAAALQLLRADPVLRQQLGARAREVAVAEHDERTMIRMLQSLYQDTRSAVPRRAVPATTPEPIHESMGVDARSGR